VECAVYSVRRPRPVRSSRLRSGGSRALAVSEATPAVLGMPTGWPPRCLRVACGNLIGRCLRKLSFRRRVAGPE